MIDCYMSLTVCIRQVLRQVSEAKVLIVCHQVPYAIALAKAVEPYNVKWIEEFLPPDDYDGYEQVKKGKGTTNDLFSFLCPRRPNWTYP